jgi:3-hexulose-6-phosphate synthase/6-phospho-3-hexuloisomerase
VTKPKLQVALDLIDLEAALRVVAETIGIADRIEVGTPLLRRYGIYAIEAVRAKFDDAVIVADYKIMDYGESAVTLAINAGANGVIVQALAQSETIEAVCHTAKGQGAFAMVDCIGIADVSHVADDLRHLPLSHLILHKSKDQQGVKGPIQTYEILEAIGGKDLPPIALAGGISPANASDMASLANIDTIIVGQAIVSSVSPRDAARSILSAWREESCWTT